MVTLGPTPGGANEAKDPTTGTDGAITRDFRIFRFSRDGGPSRFDIFEAEVEPASTVLDALRWIKIHRDPIPRHPALVFPCFVRDLRG